jgi:hypothetical protein
MESETSEELLPCPLHGGGALITSFMLDERMGYNTRYTISVACCSLQLTGQTKQNHLGWADDPNQLGKKELIESWNRRKK